MLNGEQIKTKNAPNCFESSTRFTMRATRYVHYQNVSNQFRDWSDQILGVALLLENRAGRLLNPETNKGIDALRAAFSRQLMDHDVFEALLEAGAEPERVSENGSTTRRLLHVIADMDPAIYQRFERS
ncbi:hypothetical protein [Vibrio ostreicida]|uniref:hypothetical protein n=1 Tax=Vibrio ostreicida TaxID=526588 RepID=UPI000970548A|nr:hypothetical protein [Vibrio ostreicida]